MITFKHTHTHTHISTRNYCRSVAQPCATLALDPINHSDVYPLCTCTLFVQQLWWQTHTPNHTTWSARDCRCVIHSSKNERHQSMKRRKYATSPTKRNHPLIWSAMVEGREAGWWSKIHYALCHIASHCTECAGRCTTHDDASERGWIQREESRESISSLRNSPLCRTCRPSPRVPNWGPAQTIRVSCASRRHSRGQFVFDS